MGIAGGGSSANMNVATPIHNDLSVVIGGNEYTKAEAIAHALSLTKGQAKESDSKALNIQAVKDFVPDDGLTDAQRAAIKSSLPTNYALILML